MNRSGATRCDIRSLEILKKYYEEYYAYARYLSQKKSPATSRFTYHKNPEQILLLGPKQTITKILKNVKLTRLLNPKVM